jgi:DNA-binding CsgD family transcriptional regulator
MRHVNETAVEVFYKTPLEDRSDLVFSYEVIGKQENGSEIILQHAITPYKLDKDSNLWLSLCRVHPTTQLRLSTLEKAFITNHNTGEQLDYIDGQFKEAIAKRLTPTDVQILRYKAEGLQEKDIAKKMNLSESCVKRKKHEIFNKLRVANVAAAVYKASQMKII